MSVAGASGSGVDEGVGVLIPGTGVDTGIGVGDGWSGWDGSE